MTEEIIMNGVESYDEMLVHQTAKLVNNAPYRGWVVEIDAEAGQTSVSINLFQLLRWLSENRPDLMKQALEER